MSNVNDNMKVNVMAMPSEDAVQMALDIYDREPNSKDAKKLLANRSVDVKAIDSTALSKTYKSNRNLVDLNLGELLGLGMLGQYFQNKDKHLYDLILSVEDSWNVHRETVISDGALRRNGEKSRMTVQQVMAQNIAGENKVLQIEELIKENIDDKNKKLKNGIYPEKAALLVSIYSETESIDLEKVIRESDLTVFSSYYAVRCRLPSLDQCYVYTLGGSQIPPEFVGDSQLFVLERYQNPNERKET